jgi:predicted nucleotidyltransferase
MRGRIEERGRRVISVLERNNEAVVAFCQKHSIHRLWLFGSQPEDRSRPESDIDLLVEFDRGKEPGLLGLADMERELSGILGGRSVDLRTPNDLSRYFRDEVIRSSQVQYAR